jgi:putative membrane protein
MKRQIIQTGFGCALMLTALVGCRTGASAQVQNAVSQTTMASAGSDVVALTDADIGAVAHTINDGEIQMAQLALTNASSPDVRSYAQMMITDHTTANRLLESNGWVPGKNPVTSVLNGQVNKQMGMLRGMSGADFDRAYIASQIDMHTTALDTFRTSLQPSAQSRDLRSTLTTMRDTVQMHLDHARHLQSGMTR